MAPSAMAAAHGMSGTSARTTTATAIVVRRTLTTTRLGHRRPMVLQVPRRRVVGGVEQHRGDEQGQGEIRRYGQHGRPRHEGQDGAAEG